MNRERITRMQRLAKSSPCRERQKTSARVNGEYEVEFSVDISAAADRAQTRVTVRRNTIVVAEQRSTIVLPRSNGITPVQ